MNIPKEEPPQLLTTVELPLLPAATLPPLFDAALPMPPTTTSIKAPHPFSPLSRHAQPKTDKEIREM